MHAHFSQIQQSNMLNGNEKEGLCSLERFCALLLRKAEVKKHTYILLYIQ